VLINIVENSTRSLVYNGSLGTPLNLLMAGAFHQTFPSIILNFLRVLL